MSHFCLVAEIQANEGKSEALAAIMKPLVEASRKEEGCVAYELYQDNSIAGMFIMREIWASEQVLEAHKETEHFRHFVATAEKEKLMQGLTVRPLTAIA